MDLTQMEKGELKEARRNIRMIYQDPYSSLNPRMTLLQIIGEPLVIHRMVESQDELQELVAELLRLVRLDPSTLNRYPHAFSGGQRQRIAIARALSLSPKVVIADEAVSALDVSVQAQILNLLKELQNQLGLTYLFVAHNLAVVKYEADRVAVMYAGKIVEIGETEELYTNPRHTLHGGSDFGGAESRSRYEAPGTNRALGRSGRSPATFPPAAPFIHVADTPKTGAGKRRLS